MGCSKPKWQHPRTVGRIAADKHIWTKHTALGMGPAMQQCLAILLFHELLEPCEVSEWAATETTRWNIWWEKRIQEQEHAERKTEMVEEGWFID